jgi:hypothetical protein
VSWNRLVVGAVALALVHGKVAADEKVTSREYKVMLNPSGFTGTDPSSSVASLWTALKPIIDSTTGLKSGSVHRYSGSFSLDKTRAVRFFDTTGSNKCVLNKANYIFRERVPMTGTTEDSSKREVTLKYRDTDSYISAKKDMSGSDGDAESKFEEDIARKVVTIPSGSGTVRVTDVKATMTSLYSFSTNEPISSSKNLNAMDDPLGIYPGLAAGVSEENASYNTSDALVIVSGLQIYERVYTGGVIDLGGLTAEVDVTLWYNKSASSYNTPLVAELSFNYELADPGDDFTHDVVWRAKQLFLGLQSMSQLDPSRATKTAFVYDYANHCGTTANPAD